MEVFYLEWTGGVLIKDKLPSVPIDVDAVMEKL